MPDQATWRVDVLMAVRAPAPWLEETLRSLAAQTFLEWNLVLVMDGYSPEIVELCSAVNPAWPVPLSVPPGSGTVTALNAGLERSSGELIARIDADDVCLPTRLEAEVEFLDTHPHCVAVATGHLVIDELSVVTSEHPLRIRDPKVQLRWFNPLVQSSMVLRRRALLEAGGYRTAARHLEDYELWLRLASVGRIGTIETPLVKYRRHSAQVTQNYSYSGEARKTLRDSRLQLAERSGESQTAARFRQWIWSMVNRVQGR